MPKDREKRSTPASPPLNRSRRCQMHAVPLVARRRRLGLLYMIFTLCAIFPTLTTSTSLSSQSAVGRWFIPSLQWKIRNRCVAGGRSSLSSRRTAIDSVAAAGNIYCDKSYMLDESDFEEEEFDIEEEEDWGPYDSEESIIARTVRGGGAAAATTTNSRIHLPGLHSGWRKKRKNGGGSKLNQKKKQAKKKLQQIKQQQIQQLESIQQTKLRQFRRAFKKKQRAFQLSLYNFNSRMNYNFPKPPYTLWRGASDEPIIGKTTLTGKIFLCNILMFGIQMMNPQITSLGAKRSDMIMEGRQLHRLITPIFLHGGIGHLMANSYSLKSMGMNVERAFGQPRLLATYIVSGITGNILSALQSPNPAVGASGAIFGLVGAYYTFLSRNQDLFGYAGHMQKSALIETIGFNLVLGMTNPMIDNWGHIGGFIGGVGCAWLFGPKLYVARIPIGDDTLTVGGFGAGKVVIDRPTLTFQMPFFMEEGMYWVNDNVRNLGRKVKMSVSNLLNSDVQEYFLDKYVDISAGAATTNNNGGDGTIYRTLKEDSISLEGSSVNVSPSDGFRQADVSELDREIRQHQRTQQRRRAPASGRSIRPRYGHLYR